MVWCSAIKHNRGMMHFPLCFPVTLIPISQMIVQVISGSDSTYILGAAVTMLSTTWSVRKPASFIRFSHNPTPQKSLELHGAESNLWQCMTIPWFKITETSTRRQQLWVSRVFPHSFEALPAAHIKYATASVMWPALCDLKHLFQVPGPPHQHSCKLVDLINENWNLCKEFVPLGWGWYINRIYYKSLITSHWIVLFSFLQSFFWPKGQSWLHGVSWHSSPKCCCMWQCLASATVPKRSHVPFTLRYEARKSSK